MRSYYDIPYIADDRRIPVSAFQIALTKYETRLFSRAIADYVCAVEAPDTRDGDSEIIRRFDCVRMLTRLTESLFEAALDSDSSVVEFHFFPPTFQETESYVRYVMFHTLNAVGRLITETKRHLKSATEAGFNDSADFYQKRLTTLEGLDFRIRLTFEKGFQAAA